MGCLSCTRTGPALGCGDDAAAAALRVLGQHVVVPCRLEVAVVWRLRWGQMPVFAHCPPRLVLVVSRRPPSQDGAAMMPPTAVAFCGCGRRLPALPERDPGPGAVGWLCNWCDETLCVACYAKHTKLWVLVGKCALE